MASPALVDHVSHRGTPSATGKRDEGSRMNTVTDTALNILNTAARFWFLVAVAGQWMFAYYIAVLYGGSALRGDWAGWNKVMPHGLVAGDTIGNAAVAVHLFLAFVIVVAGPLQLVPQIRACAPTFHHWNGRVYLLTSFVVSLAGLYMVWTRGTVGGTAQHIAISVNAILIMLCAAMTLRFAIARKIDIHRRWALRLFMVVGGVWFFRVGLMLWLVINKGPVGFDPKTFQGPFLTFLAFAQYLLPLALLEIYLRTRDRGSAQMRVAVAAGLFVLTIAMGVGIFGATRGMWLPNL